MPRHDNLIYGRIDYLCEQLGKFGVKNFNWLDCDEIVITNRFSSKGCLWVESNNVQGSLMVFEKYKFEGNKLKIVHYCYTFHDSNGNERFRADNSEHHNVHTTPHHIHDFRFKNEGEVKPFQRQDRDNPDITEFFAHIRGKRK